MNFKWPHESLTLSFHAGNLGKRRKGTFGPPIGTTGIIFVDDMNMPEVETYGAQPPIELLRQLVDFEGYYDLKEKSWVHIVDTVMCCAMGPPGGGRNGTTPRFLRHFHLLCVDSFDDDTLTLIFSTISASHCVETPSRHRRDSSPGMMAVGGLFFEFEAVRTESSDRDAPRRYYRQGLF
jgi:hypothetical protein